MTKYFILIICLLTFCSEQGCKPDNKHETSTADLNVKIYLQKEYWGSYDRILYSGGPLTKPLPEDRFAKPLRQKKYDIKLYLINNSPKTISIMTMSTFWWKNFWINNDYIYFHLPEEGWDHNVSHSTVIQPNDSVEFEATLERDLDYDDPNNEESQATFFGQIVPETKIGFLFIDAEKCKSHECYDSIMGDRSKWNKLIWSNPLYLNK